MATSIVILGLTAMMPVEGLWFGWIAKKWAIVLPLWSVVTWLLATEAARSTRRYFDRQYEIARSLLVSLPLGIIIADEGLLRLVYGERTVVPATVNLAPHALTGVEQQLRLAATYFVLLCTLARGRRPSARELRNPASQRSRNWGALAIVGLGCVTAFAGVGLLILAVGVPWHITGRVMDNLQRDARLAALCDFFAGGERGWWRRGKLPETGGPWKL
jgi:hypothetical protein